VRIRGANPRLRRLFSLQHRRGFSVQLRLSESFGMKLHDFVEMR
jgi:hypothetical protein